MALAETYADGAERAASGATPRVGTDVQAVAAVLESVRGPLRHRYLARVFTAGELADCGIGTDADLLPIAESLAARFAAKEAVVKVLRPAAAAPRPPWTDIEIVREPSGAPRLELHRAAARQATEAGLGSWTCSLSHDGGVAVATVVALETRPATTTLTDPTNPTNRREVPDAH